MKGGNMKNKAVDLVAKKSTINQIISWQSPDFVFYKKNTNWYIVLVTAGVALCAAFYFMDNLTGIIMVVLAVIVLIVTANKKPKNRTYRLTSEEITINDEKYLLSDFKSFYITFVDQYATLYLEKTKKLSSPLSILLPAEETENIAKLLKQVLPENTKITYNTNDLFAKWFKF